VKIVGEDRNANARRNQPSVGPSSNYFAAVRRAALHVKPRTWLAADLDDRNFTITTSYPHSLWLYCPTIDRSQRNGIMLKGGHHKHRAIGGEALNLCGMRR
jgi:hypothetical protein